MASKGEVSLIDNGNGICNAVYIDDVCDAIHAALQRYEEVKGEVFFINADQSILWREFNLTFASMVNPSLKIRNWSSEEVLDYWRSQRPTFRSTFLELARLTASLEFHKQLARVMILRRAIRWAKSTVKGYLPEDQFLRLKRKANPTSLSGSKTDPQAPTEDRIVREAFPIRFSNKLAKEKLGWKPLYDFQRGSEITRLWLEFAGVVPPQKYSGTGSHLNYG